MIAAKSGEELRQKIIETARIMDYRPNRSAAALSRQEIRLISVAPLEPVNYYSFVNKGLISTARELEDLRCTVDFRWYSSPNAHDEVRRILRDVLSGHAGVSGMVITCSYEPHYYQEELREISRKDADRVQYVVCEWGGAYRSCRSKNTYCWKNGG